MLRLFVLSAAALAALAPPAAGGVIYSQPPDFPAYGFSARTSDYATPGAAPFGTVNGTYYLTYDSFQLAATSTVTGLTWQGLAFDATTGGATSTPVSAFNIGFYANNPNVPGGQPGAQLYSAQIGYTATAAGDSTVDFGGPPATVTVYDYAGTLPAGFTAAGGVPYWVSIQGVMAAPAAFSWTSSAVSPIGDGVIYQDAGPVATAFEGTSGRTRYGYDLAFALEGAPTPEPATLGAFALVGAAGFGYARRRMKGAPAAA